MKNILKYVLIGWVVLFFACTDGFEELNKDPQKATQANLVYMFTGLESVKGIEGEYFRKIGGPYHYTLAQTATQGSDMSDFQIADAMQGISAGIWGQYRSFINNYRYLESQLIANGVTDLIDQATYNNRLAVMYILKARLVFQTTDFHGDMPYSEAGRAVEGLLRPKYDIQESIYRSLMDDLNWAIENITVGKPSFGTTADVMLQDDMQQWKNMGNAFRLKYALRMSNADLVYAKSLIDKVFSDISSLPAPASGYDLNNFNIDQIKPGVNYGRIKIGEGAGDNDNWGFYYWGFVRIGTSIWDQMADGYDETGKDFFDPRALIFFDSNKNLKYKPLPQSFGKRNEFEKNTDTQNGYDNPRNASDEGYHTGKNALFSTVNYNLVKGTVKNYPELWIGAAEVQFMLAEVYARSNLGQQDLSKAQQCYEAGIVTSLKFWFDLVYNQVLNADAPPQSAWVDKPAKPTAVQFTAFLNNPKVKFDATKSLNLILTQRWVDYFRRPHEAFFLRMEKGDEMLPTQDLDLASTAVALKRLPMHESEASDNTENWEAGQGGRAGDVHTKALWWQKQ